MTLFLAVLVIPVGLLPKMAIYSIEFLKQLRITWKNATVIHLVIVVCEVMKIREYMIFSAERKQVNS